MAGSISLLSFLVFPMNSLFSAFWFLMATCVCAASAVGQVPEIQDGSDQDTTNQDKPAAEEEQVDKIPPAEEIEIKTKDNVRLQCTFFPGTKGKQTIPVILLHDWGGSRADMLEQAKILQSDLGCAVIAPDLRGHGESLKVEGMTSELDRDRWKPAEIATIVNDIEACKVFLFKYNNEGKLNIDWLTIVAEGVTCIHAVNWTVNDWAYPAVGGVKYGQDVKTLVLIHPEEAYRSLNMVKSLREPVIAGPDEQALGILILGNADKGQKSLRTVEKIHNNLLRRREPPEDERKRHLRYFEFVTLRQKRMIKSELALEKVVRSFIEFESERYVDSHPWQDRSR